MSAEQLNEKEINQATSMMEKEKEKYTENAIEAELEEGEIVSESEAENNENEEEVEVEEEEVSKRNVKAATKVSPTIDDVIVLDVSAEDMKSLGAADEDNVVLSDFEDGEVFDDDIDDNSKGKAQSELIEKETEEEAEAKTDDNCQSKCLKNAEMVELSKMVSPKEKFDKLNEILNICNNNNNNDNNNDINMILQKNDDDFEDGEIRSPPTIKETLNSVCCKFEIKSEQTKLLNVNNEEIIEIFDSDESDTEDIKSQDKELLIIEKRNEQLKMIAREHNYFKDITFDISDARAEHSTSFVNDNDDNNVDVDDVDDVDDVINTKQSVVDEYNELIATSIKHFNEYMIDDTNNNDNNNEAKQLKKVEDLNDKHIVEQKIIDNDKPYELLCTVESATSTATSIEVNSNKSIFEFQVLTIGEDNIVEVTELINFTTETINIKLDFNEQINLNKNSTTTTTTTKQNEAATAIQHCLEFVVQNIDQKSNTEINNTLEIVENNNSEKIEENKENQQQLLNENENQTTTVNNQIKNVENSTTSELVAWKKLIPIDTVGVLKSRNVRSNNIHQHNITPEDFQPVYEPNWIFPSPMYFGLTPAENMENSPSPRLYRKERKLKMFGGNKEQSYTPRPKPYYKPDFATPKTTPNTTPKTTPETQTQTPTERRPFCPYTTRFRIPNNTITLYDGYGRLRHNGADICDCGNEQCSGCWYKCYECSSIKCGLSCRRYRQVYPDVWNVRSTKRPQ